MSQYRYADLRGADFRQAGLDNADFRNADLSYAKLRRASLRRASFDCAVLYHADLYRADLSQAVLSKSLLSYANLRRANLYAADLVRVSACNTDFKWANLESANLAFLFAHSANFRGADLRDANLESADLEGADMRDANLQGADLTRADLAGTDFRGADLRGANLAQAKCVMTMFDGARLDGVNFEMALIDGASLNVPVDILPDPSVLERILHSNSFEDINAAIRTAVILERFDVLMDDVVFDRYGSTIVGEIAQCPAKGAAPILIRALKSTSPYTRIVVANPLVRLLGKDAIPHLAPLLHDPDTSVVFAVIGALTHLRSLDDATANVMGNLLSHENTSIAQAAYDCLIVVGRRDLTELYKMFGQINEHIEL